MVSNAYTKELRQTMKVSNALFIMICISALAGDFYRVIVDEGAAQVNYRA